MDDRQYHPHSVDWTGAKVARFWDFKAARRTSEFFSERHSRDLADEVLRFRPHLVVDIGCGTGPFVAEIAKRGVSAIGVDSSPGALEAARSRAIGIRPPPEFFLGSVAALPLPDGSVDAATLFEVVEHLDDETLVHALAEAGRVLAPGGRLVVTTPNHEDLAASTVQCPDCGAEFHSMQHVRSWTSRSLADQLRSSGFGPVSVRALRFVENGPSLERIVRRGYYLVRRQKPRLLALATRAVSER